MIDIALNEKSFQVGETATYLAIKMQAVGEDERVNGKDDDDDKDMSWWAKFKAGRKKNMKKNNMDFVVKILLSKYVPTYLL